MSAINKKQTVKKITNKIAKAILQVIRKMKTVTKIETIPEKSTVANEFGKIDYFDTYRIIKATNDSIEKITDEMFKLPKWVKCLMNIRDSIVGIFGLKTSKEIQKEQTVNFPIIAKSENEIVSGANDKHLNYRVSVLVDRENSFIYLTTLVHFNNFGGRLYFLPVKPFHKIIVKSMLKQA